MLALISPAKKLDFETEPKINNHTLPNLLENTEILVSTARALSQKKLATIMNLSDKLAELNFQRYKDFVTPFHLGNAKQAALVFNGDTYQGLKAHTLDEPAMEYAQQHLRILSGLYGILRPLDLIQPYRLEMGAKFEPPEFKNLYDFWEDQITAAINEVITHQKDNTVINLASTEYFKAVKAKELVGPVITPIFKEVKDGESRTIGMFAKRARGSMAHFMITNRIDSVDGLKNFNTDGYEYRSNLSDESNWVFTRLQPSSRS